MFNNNGIANALQTFILWPVESFYLLLSISRIYFISLFMNSVTNKAENADFQSYAAGKVYIKMLMLEIAEHIHAQLIKGHSKC